MKFDRQKIVNACSRYLTACELAKVECKEDWIAEYMRPNFLRSIFRGTPTRNEAEAAYCRSEYASYNNIMGGRWIYTVKVLKNAAEKAAGKYVCVDPEDFNVIAKFYE